jgi:hypothetical protein
MAQVIISNATCQCNIDDPSLVMTFSLMFLLCILRRCSRNDQQCSLVVPLLYSINWLLHVSAVVHHHHGASWIRVTWITNGVGSISYNMWLCGLCAGSVYCASQLSAYDQSGCSVQGVYCLPSLKTKGSVPSRGMQCTVGPWLTNSIRSRGLVVTQVGR